MHPAIELLLARIKSNPEEFAERGYGRWSDIIADLGTVAPKDEWSVLVDKLTAVHMDKIHRQIMKELCDPNAPKQLEFNFSSPRLITSKDMLAEATALLNGYSNVDK